MRMRRETALGPISSSEVRPIKLECAPVTLFAVPIS